MLPASMRVLLILIGLCSINTLVFAGPDLNHFCNKKKDEQCLNLQLANKASVTITSVVVRQKQSDGCKAERHRFKRNMPGTVEGNYSSYTIGVVAGCSYKISFKTTKQCHGGKKTVKVNKAKKGKLYAYIVGGCGTLATGLGKK